MPGIALASHAAGTAVFTAMTACLYARRHIREQTPLLIIASAVTMGWSAISFLYAYHLVLDFSYVALLDALRASSWCFCVLQILKFNSKQSLQRRHQHASLSILLSILTLILCINAFYLPPTWLGFEGKILSKLSFIAHLTFAIVGLALIEQLFRCMLPERRWAIKFFCMGLGCLFCYDFYMYANAILFNHIDLAIWSARGAIHTLVAPFIALSAFRNRTWIADMVPSRQMIMRSTVFMSCGLYLVLMASMGYYIREHGGSWGQALQVVFMVGAMLVLSTLLISSRTRAWLKIFMAKHFFKSAYDYREEWLKFNQLLTTRDSERTLGQRVIRALADMVESPKGILFEKRGCQEYVLTNCWNIDEKCQGQIIQSGFTLYLQERKKAVELKTLTEQLRTEQVQLPEAIASLHWAWVIVPLLHMEELYGFIVLDHPRAQMELNWEILDLLHTASMQAAIFLSEQKVSEELAQSKQFEGFNRLSAYVVHDLKNAVAQLSMIERNKQKHGANPRFIESVFNTVSNVTKKMEKLLLQVRNKETRFELEACDVVSTLNEVIRECQAREPKPSLVYLCEKSYLIQGAKLRLTNVLCHLIENAQQAAPEGQVTIKVNKEGPYIVIAIIDNGMGMSQDFVQNKLFKPFISTKGLTGMGIGVFQAKEYVEAVGGTIDVKSKLNMGTTFLLKFKIANSYASTKENQSKSIEAVE